MVISLQRQDYNRAKHCREFGETEQRIWRNRAENLAKPMRKSSHIDRYEHGERSLLVFTPTVMNMENGRCETTFSMLSPDKKIGFKLFSPYFQEMITWGRNNRGNNRGNHKSHKGATKTILLTPITVEKKLFLLFPCCSMLSSFLITISSSTTRCGCAYGQLLPHAPLHAGATSPPE